MGEGLLKDRWIITSSPQCGCQLMKASTLVLAAHLGGSSAGWGGCLLGSLVVLGLLRWPCQSLLLQAALLISMFMSLRNKESTASFRDFQEVRSIHLLAEFQGDFLLDGCFIPPQEHTES